MMITFYCSPTENDSIKTYDRVRIQFEVKHDTENKFVRNVDIWNKIIYSFGKIIMSILSSVTL